MQHRSTNAKLLTLYRAYDVRKIAVEKSVFNYSFAFLEP